MKITRQTAGNLSLHRISKRHALHAKTLRAVTQDILYTTFALFASIFTNFIKYFHVEILNVYRNNFVHYAQILSLIFFSRVLHFINAVFFGDFHLVAVLLRIYDRGFDKIQQVIIRIKIIIHAE